MSNRDDLLKKFDIQLQHIVVENETGTPIKMVTTGGIEVIEVAKDRDDISKMLDNDAPLRYLDGQRMPFRYVETKFDYSKLEELLKYKSIKSLSKEDALKINSDIKSKNSLEDKIVYITDKEPMTNSLALAKQFDLNHMDVVKKIFELGSMYPSTLMKIKADVYSDEVIASDGRPKKESNTESVGTENRKESSLRLKHGIFYHIQEDVYYQFLKKLGTPKGMDTPLGKERLVFREDKQDEYFKAFQNVRAFLHDTGTKEKELEAIIRTRTQYTKELMASVYDYVTKYNDYYKDKHINLVNANKAIFNVVNHTAKINAINYIPPTDEELKDNRNRKTKDEVLQQEISSIEYGIKTGIKLASKHHLDLLDVLEAAFDKTGDEIKVILKEYNAEYLLDS